ncbi:hypothetical protein FA13DRAFT_1745828 [Coprinellus micaceus]|uniref:F-box domain-containing protein n=1 Tax=Coprinellus micaceus TaxID=71717 RepID=A0A4Y7SAV5_COPMI|nr:hypothetical protein FA13DRAFT_1745828 [Coprinellus micaceus]
MPKEDDGDADREEPAVSGPIDHFSSLRTSHAVDVCNRLPEEILAEIFALLGKATISTDRDPRIASIHLNACLPSTVHRRSSHPGYVVQPWFDSESLERR